VGVNGWGLWRDIQYQAKYNNNKIKDIKIILPYKPKSRQIDGKIMPKRVTTTELQRIEDALLRHPEGLSLLQLQKELRGSISRRTLSRRISALLDAGRIHRRGEARSTRYVHGAAGPPVRHAPEQALARRADHTIAVPAGHIEITPQKAELVGQFQTPEGVVTIELSSAARDILAYVNRPAASRTPRGYERRFLDDYVPNKTAYIPDNTKVHLHRIGKPIAADRAAGTFARDILSRFLIDLSWASSRLEGNTYSRLDTERLIQFGQEAEGKDAKETQMILNHKAAIELLVEDNADIGINHFTLLNLHALLSENLMADPEASGHLRRRPVDIGGSVYTPSAIPQIIEECFSIILQKTRVIDDPFERALFLMVQLPYLQPFEDVNKRVSRLAANIPLIRANLCPLSFVDVPERAYIAGTLAVYEMTRVELLRDVFVWAYERSCERYVVIRDSVAEPDRFRMRYREALTEVIGQIVRAKRQPSAENVRALAKDIVDASDLEKFVELAIQEFRHLGEFNIARYRVRLSEYWAWFNATHDTSATAQ
jgi:DNA-binding transcriptional ArsR family regulator